MKTIFLNLDNLGYWKSKSKNNVMALGFFDGVHKGHQQVIKKAKEKANEENLELNVMSFFPHPKSILTNGRKKVNYLMPIHDKAEQLKSMGVNRFYVVEFDKNFASLSPQHFVFKYLLSLKTKHAVAGFDFTYGKKGLGTIDRISSDSHYLIDILKVDKIEYEGEKISSTLIRKTISDGTMEKLPALIGRNYEVKGKIENNVIQTKSYYMLPKSGYYKVKIKANQETYEASVKNDIKNERCILQEKKLSSMLDGLDVWITWDEYLGINNDDKVDEND